MIGSMPNCMMNLLIILALHIREPLNIFSTIISLLSLVYGVGDFLAYLKTSNYNPPFMKVIWCSLAIFLGT